jgi:hypothetical protein
VAETLITESQLSEKLIVGTLSHESWLLDSSQSTGVPLSVADGLNIGSSLPTDGGSFTADVLTVVQDHHFSPLEQMDTTD